MSGIHEAIEERWSASAALLALVPLDRCCKGNFSSYAASEETPVYPRVSRLTQFEQKAHRTSDRRIFRSTVVFNITCLNEEDGQAVREAFWGREGIDGFENQDFETTDVRVLKAREEDWSEFQDEDDVWIFTMTVEFVWYYLPIVVIVIPTGSLMYSQSSAVTASAVAETSLVGTGPGDVTVSADTQSIGDKFAICFSGYFETGVTAPGRVRFNCKWGANNLRTPWINLLAGQEDIAFLVRYEFTRQTIGATGTYVANGLAFVENGTPGPAQCSTLGAVTLRTDQDADFDVLLELDTAGNTFVCSQLDIQKLTVQV